MWIALTKVVYGFNSPRVNSVRSEIMSLFNPDENTRSLAAVEDLTGSVSDATENFCSSFTTCLVNHLCCLVKSGPQARNELLAIVKNGAKFGVEFGIQKSRIVWYGIQQLPETFNHASDMMEAHRLYEDPKALDGKRILVVTHPAIVATGKPDGLDYSIRPRVLKKAVVWMG